MRARKFDVDGAYAQFTQARELHQLNKIVEVYDHVDILEYEEAKTLVCAPAPQYIFYTC